MENNIDKDYIDEDLKIRLTIDKYLFFWRWFVISVIVSLILSFVYTRYADPLYKSSSSILVKDEKKGGMMSELSAFSDLGIGGSVNNVDNEIEVIKSRTLVESTVQKLNLTVSIFQEGSVKNGNLYNNAPISVFFLMLMKIFTKEMSI